MADDNSPDIASGIVKARAAGYSDDEIADHLSDTVPGIKKAREAGYSNVDIVHHLAGTADIAPEGAEKPSALKDVAMQLPTGFNDTLANTAGAPVDGVAYLMRKAGLPIPANAFGGSQSIKNGLGMINANPDNAPAQTTAGQFARAAGGGVAGMMVPEAGLAAAAPAINPQLLSAARAALGNGSSVGRTVATGAASGLGSEAAGQATQGTALEPYARMAGGMVGGAAAGAATAPRQAARALPTLDEVNAAKTAGYNAPEVKNLRIDPAAVSGLGDNIASSLEGRGMFREDHPNVFSSVDRLRNANGPVSYDQLDAVRKALNGRAGEIDAFGRPTPTSAAAGHAKGLLDDFIHGDMTDPQNVLSGNPIAANVHLHNARQNAGAAIRAEQVLRQVGNAENDAAAANSGMNVQNRIRQKLKTFIQNDGAKMGGYTDAEQAQMQRLVRGSMLMNGLRHVGNAIGGSGISVLPGAFIGHAALGPVGAALPAAGVGLKLAANYATKRMANNMADTLLSRAPLVQRTLAANRAISNANRATTHIGATEGALRALAASLLHKQNSAP